jgi:hypothetical protein
MLIQDVREWVPANGMLVRGDYAKIETGRGAYVGEVRYALNVGSIESPDWRIVLRDLWGETITYVQSDDGGNVYVPKMEVFHEEQY